MRIKRSVLSRLQQRGKMGESYTDLVERILDEIEGKSGTEIPYGHLGHRPPNCDDPDNPKHVCYKDCL